MNKTSKEPIDSDVLNDNEENHEGTPKRKLKLIYILVPIALIVLIGGGYLVSTLFSGGSSSTSEQSSAETNDKGKRQEQSKVVYVELEPMTVNLRTTGRQQRFLKLVVRLEVEKDEDKKAIEQAMPRIRDQFQVFLRELRVEDMEGSSGAYRLREELLQRINAVSKPAQVRDVLFDELLVQ